MKEINLTIEGTFTTQEELEKYLNAVLESVKLANSLKLPFHNFCGHDNDRKNEIFATAKHK